MQPFDVIVLGAGAAGMFCAGIAGQRGLRVLLIDHATKVAEKIRISGGGRCNFTNTGCSPAQFLSANPHFCRSALARYTPDDFIALLRRHGITFHEKHRGQLFCDGSSQQIIELLLAECGAGAVVHWQPCRAQGIRHTGDGFEIDTDRGPVASKRLVVATGGLSIPKIGATDLGYRIARQFAHPVIEPRPGLVPLTFAEAAWAPFSALAGVSLQAAVAAGATKPRSSFHEDLLFTHRGLSGPAALQASSYWREGGRICIDLLPAADLAETLLSAKHASRRQLGNELALLLPQRLADAWLTQLGMDAMRPMPQVRDQDLQRLVRGLREWQVEPSGTEGWRKAEVTVGGVDTRQLGSFDMQSRLVSGLYFIGEVVDVTGWLGGYNFQWAWASAAACARALGAGPSPGPAADV